MRVSVAEIEAMDRAALSANWRRAFGTPVPKRLSSPYLRRFIAFAQQAQESGGLPKGFIGKLDRAAGAASSADSPILKPGGRLIREWNGVSHVVDVVEGGFLWRGQHFKSLSPIARAITGARWSGPRFFGLKRSNGG